MIKKFVSPEEKIDRLLQAREQKIQFYEPVPQKNNETVGVVKKKDNVFIPKSEGLKKMFDNLKFTDKVNNEPLITKKQYNGYSSHSVMDISHFLNLRLYPRSIYTTDKLLRLIASSNLETLKKYVSKKRKVSMDFLYIILILVGVACVVMVILFLILPMAGIT